MNSRILLGIQFYNAFIGENIDNKVTAIKIDTFNKRSLYGKRSCGLKSLSIFTTGISRDDTENTDIKTIFCLFIENIIYKYAMLISS